MLKFYYHPSPNPAKVALFLEESGLPYEVVPVDTRKGEQFSREFTAINPNNKTPAIEDGGVRVFDSNAILLYLAEKTDTFLPEKTLAARGELLCWMMFFATGIGPYSGQAVHFKHFAPKGLDYAVDRYLYEARRHYGILNTQLSKAPFVLGGNYTIADISAWGWVRALPFILGEDVWSAFPHIKTWFDRINERPAARRANALTVSNSRLRWTRKRAATCSGTHLLGNSSPKAADIYYILLSDSRLEAPNASVWHTTWTMRRSRSRNKYGVDPNAPRNPNTNQIQ